VAFKQKQKEDQKAMEAMKVKAGGKGPLSEKNPKYRTQWRLSGPAGMLVV